MSEEPLRPTRRIVTANDEAGLSFIAEDGPPPRTDLVSERPGYASSNIWRTTETPARVDAADSVLVHSGVLPPPGGCIIRVIDYPPRHPDPEIRRQQATAMMRRLFPDATHDADHLTPGMHVTRTIDYAIVLEGVMTAILDKAETEMRPGDILIQRATNHAWENRSNAMARICFVLIDGRSDAPVSHRMKSEI